MGLKLDFCPTVGRFSPFTRSNRTNHRLGMRTSDFKVGQIRTWLSLAENPGSNRNQEGIHSSCQSEDTSKKNVENSIFADFGIQYLSQFVVIYNQIKTSLWPYQKSLLPQFFLSIKHFLVPIAIFSYWVFFFMAFQRRALEAFNEVELTQNHIKKDPGRLRHRSKKEHLWGDKVYLLLLEMNQKSIESSFLFRKQTFFLEKIFFLKKIEKKVKVWPHVKNDPGGIRTRDFEILKGYLLKFDALTSWAIRGYGDSV